MSIFLLGIAVIVNSITIFKIFKILQGGMDDLQKDIDNANESLRIFEASLSKQKEFNDYVIGYIHRQNEKELDEALEATKEDIAAGRFVECTVEEHIRSLDDLLGGGK